LSTSTAAQKEHDQPEGRWGLTQSPSRLLSGRPSGEDPDVILVGEMRDLETTSIALTAAETGHLVFATLHTNDTVQTVTGS